MSWDICIVDPVTHETLTVPTNHLIIGGTYAVGGTNELWLNVTYNYAEHFNKAFQNDNGIHTLNDMSGAEAIHAINDAISKLADDVDANYWKATEGNAKRALYGILALCQLRPDGVIQIY